VVALKAKGPVTDASARTRLKLAQALWGWVPHSGQTEVWCDEHKRRVVVCGRRWGKTEMGAVDDATCLIAYPEWECMVIAPSRDQVMISYRETKQRLESVKELDGAFKYRETPHPEIEGPGGAILYRTAGESGKYIRGRGKRIRRIRIDEAAYVKEEVIDSVVEPMCLDHGAEMILQGTPFGRNHFYRSFLKGDSGKLSFMRSFHYPTATNPHLDTDQYELIKDRIGEDSLQWRCEYLAEFVDDAGTVFSWKDIERALYDPVAHFDSKDHCLDVLPKYGGIDVARYSDYSVVIVGALDRGMVWCCDADRFRGLDYPDVKSRIYDVVSKYDATCRMDTTHGSVGDAILGDLKAGEWVGAVEGNVERRRGLLIDGVELTAGTKRQLVDKLRLWLAKGMVKIPMSDQASSVWSAVRDELQYFQYSVTDAGNIKLEAQHGYHDDTVIALGMLCMAAYGNYEAAIDPEDYPVGSVGWLMRKQRFDRESAPDMRIRPRKRYAVAS
jgi:hypothetical protein